MSEPRRHGSRADGCGRGMSARRIKRVGGSAAADRPRRIRGRPQIADRAACRLPPQRSVACAHRVDIDTRRRPRCRACSRVFTADDIAGFTPLIATSRMKDYHATPILPLANGKVRYVGEPIVAVLAESRYLAEDALELIEIEFEPLGRSSPIRKRRSRETRHCCTRRRAPTSWSPASSQRGDVEGEMQSAPVRGRRAASACAARRRWRWSRAPTSRNTTAGGARSRSRPRPRSPASCAMRSPRSLDLPGHSVRVVAPDVGGGFGGKASLYPEELLVCRAGQAARPLACTGPATAWKT